MYINLRSSNKSSIIVKSSNLDNRSSTYKQQLNVQHRCQFIMSCPDCYKGGIHDHKGDAKGHEEQIHGLRTYITGPSATSTSKSTIIYFTDAFGLELINNKILADRFATGTGLRVLMPDIIPGGPVSIGLIEPMENAFKPVTWWDIWGQIKRVGYVLNCARYLIFFAFAANPKKPAAHKGFLEWTRKVKSELPPGAKLGACGFCWGGYPSTKLCSEPAVDGGTESLIDAQFCAHPSNLKPSVDVIDAVTTFKVPYSMAIAGRDFVFTPTVGEEIEATLRERVGNGDGENGYNYEFKVYQDCTHGFAVRARPGDTVQVNAADEACEQAVRWFKKWLL
jgi:dienelactone hydrolase